MRFHVIGAGMAGLLAGAVLRTDCVAVWEAQSELPNNHSALLRFRTDHVAQAINVKFDEVNVIKSVVPYVGNPIGDMIAYSIKTNGRASLRSIVSAEGKVERRFIAPSNLIEAMACRVSAPINLGRPLNGDELLALRNHGGSGMGVISTMPMPLLMSLLQYEDKPEFGFIDGFTVNVDLPDCDVCATLYFPSPSTDFYRASITRSKLTLEYCNTGKYKAPTYEAYANDKELAIIDIKEALMKFGFRLGTSDVAQMHINVKRQAYTKIKPIDERARKRFIMWASDRFNIYSLGRFATWRPGLLMDDVVNDIRVIQHIASNGNYDHKKAI